MQQSAAAQKCANSAGEAEAPLPKLEDLIGEAAARAVVDFRHDLHAHPEIGMSTERTSEAVEAFLKRLGVDEIARFAGTGIAAVVRGGKPGPRIGFRADMDALPAPDESGAPWASTCEMRAHLCGHDGHTAGLLGFAAWAASHRADFAGEILLIFQPGEEGWAGADKMIKDGLFERYPVREVFAAHITGLEPLGKILAREGPMTACADLFDIVIEGRGGHGARPHQAVDPVPAAAELILGLQTIVSRNVDPALPAVISIGSVQAGDPGAVSVIPERVRLSGTARTTSPEVRDLIERRIAEAAEGAAKLAGATAKTTYTRLYPPQINDKALYEAVAPVLKRVAGNRFESNLLSMGGEDFAFMSECVPGLYFRIGNDDASHHSGVHNPKFDFNDRVFGIWVKAFAEIAMARLPA